MKYQLKNRKFIPSHKIDDSEKYFRQISIFIILYVNINAAKGTRKAVESIDIAI